MEIIITTPLFGALALISFFLRVLSRFMTGIKASWGMDDWMMVPVVVCVNLALTILRYRD
jgi:hypothetical protein